MGREEIGGIVETMRASSRLHSEAVTRSGEPFIDIMRRLLIH